MRIIVVLLLLISSACGPARYEQRAASDLEGSQGGRNPDNNKPDDPRDRIVDTFIQDHGGNQVDILVISDDSFSMAADQKKLGLKFGNFVASLGSIDWQVGVTTSDLSEKGAKGSLLEFAKGQKILTADTPNAQKLFLETVTRECNAVGTCGSSTEQPLGAIVQAMNKSSTANAGFFRPQVDFAALIITDEDEMSDGRNVKATRPQQVVDAFTQIFGDSKNFSAYGIIIKPGDKACLDEQQAEHVRLKSGNAYYGKFAANLAKITQGETFSICANDYGPALKDIAGKIRKLVNSFELSATPVPNSVEVVLKPAADIDYHVEGKRVIFDEAPIPGTSIQVSYLPVQE